MPANEDPSPMGITSILDTDLYKLTMQWAVLKSYPDADSTYSFTNRTPDLKLTRKGFNWLQEQVSKLSQLALTDDEEEFLAQKCSYLPNEYVAYLKQFRFRPDEQVTLTFTPVHEFTKRAEEEEGAPDHTEFGDLSISVKGKWVEAMLYEIPLLVLVSECYFRFSNTDWDYDGQEENAYKKGLQLLSNGCTFSEFGTRRRRSYHTQELVLTGLLRAQKEYAAQNPDGNGMLAGTSNVHFAHRFGLTPIGTVAHEWMMGIAALTDTYTSANAIALENWVKCFGKNLTIALTDTFGTPQFLECFKKKCEFVDPPQSYAEIFAGTRQDSGDPAKFVKLMRKFYDSQGITERKTIVFSDSLDVEKCLEYKQVAEEHNFATSFGVGTFLTNDFVHRSGELAGKKSVPLNIVIKISSANGKPAVKISDNIGKNTGDAKEVERAKAEIAYSETTWEDGDESHRWG
ncbi:Quinolinate phosphoribosyl transferase [Pyronema domesticum]|uniref:Nicotinate phosphoribosyltransferase n=1 Tax=Pyronema omphalodes (strain CBS 100304) TaxID=1076935 RepID=U4LA80_PYROM|nr:Quinolinate phosphoribosyl transferase [Pyronema domesticum]CCX15867.1 Similar to Nicotinate phosphoribosyltransferase; acc. no. P39683 [Pyronema omphalodes CBS 100304]